MFLTYKGCELANYLIDLLEGTCDEVIQWTRHDAADDLPCEVNCVIDPRYPVTQWFDCQSDHRTLILVVAESPNACIYTLYGVDGKHQATRLRRAVEYPGSSDVLFILANQVIDCANYAQCDAVNQFLGGIMRDKLADLAEDE